MTENRETLDSGLPSLIADFFANFHTAQPGQVISYDPATNLAEVQPCLKRKYRGQSDPVQLPVITDVPVVFPGAGDWWLTFPISEGDYVLLLFAERSIATWLDQGGIQSPAALRRFALSDAIAVPGILPGPSVLSPAVATDALELRARDGDVKISITSAGVEIDAAKVVINGETDAAALKSKVDLFISTLDTMFRTWVPAPTDGGAALKTLFTAAFPAPPTSVGSTKLKVDA